MKLGKKEIVLVNDRVLIKHEKPDERTHGGLYLPQTAIEKATVQTGRIVAVGPGLPIPVLDRSEEEPWRDRGATGNYLPLQAQVGDLALYVREHAVDVKIEGEDYVVVPQSALLVLLRDQDWTEPEA
ncbi:MAG: co-chaperone GroES [Planctomycetes bacterium]|nr:co-chaperone GroES [Planctomycetota bacterium]